MSLSHSEMFPGMDFGEWAGRRQHAWEEASVGVQSVTAFVFSSQLPLLRHDQDNSKAIDRNEMVNVLRSIYSMVSIDTSNFQTIN